MSYTPQPGSLPFKVIEFLRGQQPGKEFTSAQLAAAVGLGVTSALRHKLEPASQAGLVIIRVAGPRHMMFSLGAGMPEAEDEVELVLPVKQRGIPVEACSSIFAYAEQRDAAPFSTAIASDGRITLQRKGRVIAELNPAESKLLVEWIDRNLSAFMPRPAEVSA